MAEAGPGPSKKPSDQDVARAELMELVRRRESTAQYVENLEQEIYLFEGAYLRNTQQRGNVVHGWNPDLHQGPQQHGRPRHQKVKEEDRIFSNSSLSSKVAVAKLAAVDLDDDDEKVVKVAPKKKRVPEESCEGQDPSKSRREAGGGGRSQLKARRRDRNAGGQFKVSQDVGRREMADEKDQGSYGDLGVDDSKSSGEGERRDPNPKNVHVLERPDLEEKTDGNDKPFDLAEIKLEPISPDDGGKNDGFNCDQDFNLAAVKEERVD